MVWTAAPEAAAAERPAAPTLPPSAAPEAKRVAALVDVTAPADAAAPVLTPLERAVSLARGLTEKALLPPQPAVEVRGREASGALGPAAGASPLVATAPSTRVTAHALAAHAPAAALKASAPAEGTLAAAPSRQRVVVAALVGSGTTAVAQDPGPSWVPTGLGNVRPEYPALARRRGLEGRTVLRVEVVATGESGTVAVLASSGHRLLDNAALDAVRRWRFVPASDVAPEVAAFIEVPVSFRLVD